MKMPAAVIVVAALAGCGSSTRQEDQVRNTVAPDHKPRDVALAVVFSGWEIFAGNDTLVDAADPSRFEGVLTPLDAALPELAQAGGEHSTAALITYGDRADVTRPWGPLRKLTHGWAGTQKDYFQKTGLELVQGIKLAATELLKTSNDRRRVMLVITDGCDTYQEGAVQAMPPLLARLAQAHAEVFYIKIKTRLSEETCDVLAGHARLLGTSIAQGMPELVRLLNER